MMSLLAEVSAWRPSAPFMGLAGGVAILSFAVSTKASLTEVLLLLVLAAVSTLGVQLLIVIKEAVGENKKLVAEVHGFSEEAKKELEATREWVKFSANKLNLMERRLMVSGYSPYEFRRQCHNVLSDWNFEADGGWGVRQLQRELQVLRQYWLERPSLGVLQDVQLRMVFRTLSDTILKEGTDNEKAAFRR